MSDSNLANETPQFGFFSLLIRSFVAPDQVYQWIRDHVGRRWIGLAILFILISLLPVLALQQQQTRALAGNQRTGQIVVSDSSGTGEVREEDVSSQSANTGLGIGLAFAFVGAPVQLILNWVAWAGLLFVAVSIFGGQAKFGQLWRLAVWSYVPIALKTIISGIYQLAIGGLVPVDFSLAAFMPNPFPTFDPSVPAEQTAASFTPPDPGQMALFQLASWFDIFVIWRLLLLILGFAIIGRISVGKSAGVVLGLWILAVIITVVPSFFLGGLF